MISKWLFKEVKSPNDEIRKDIKRMQRHVLTIPHNGKNYKLYELSSVYDMPGKRYQIMNQFIEDARLNIQKAELTHYMGEMEELLNKAAKDDPRAFADALVLTKWMKVRSKISMDVDLVMRVLSCCLIFEDEDPLDYDYDINDYKIELFEKYGVTAFFLSNPIRKYLQLISTSKLDMEAILDQRKKKRQVSKELKEMGISVWNMYKEEPS